MVDSVLLQVTNIDHVNNVGRGLLYENPTSVTRSNVWCIDSELYEALMFIFEVYLTFGYRQDSCKKFFENLRVNVRCRMDSKLFS